MKKVSECTTTEELFKNGWIDQNALDRVENNREMTAKAKPDEQSNGTPISFLMKNKK